MKTKILEILEKHQGRANPITGRELASLLNQRGDRQIRLIIRELIKEGVPVASGTDSPAGYFIVNSYAEAENYKQSVRGRLIEDAKRIRDFRRAASNHFNKSHQVVLI